MGASYLEMRDVTNPHSKQEHPHDRTDVSPLHRHMIEDRRPSMTICNGSRTSRATSNALPIQPTRKIYAAFSAGPASSSPYASRVLVRRLVLEKQTGAFRQPCRTRKTFAAYLAPDARKYCAISRAIPTASPSNRRRVALNDKSVPFK
jgi:hypothetical protein